MEYMQIPLPDFDFADIVKEKANELCEEELYLDAVEQFFSNEQLKRNQDKKAYLRSRLNELNSKEDKIVFISVVLTHLSGLIEQAQQEAIDGDALYFYTQAINRARYYYYGQANNVGYSFDKNAFTDDESNELDSKIDAIINALNRLQAGQEVLYDQFEEVKERVKVDFESLKTDKPLGKKRFFKIALGTIGSYTGNKVADEIFAQLRPYVVDLLKDHSPQHLIEGFTKMLG